MASRKKLKTYAELVQMISDRYHDSKHLPMAERLGVASALVPQWAKGTVKRPGHENVARLCRTYDLDYWGVQDLIAGKPGADPFGDDHGWREWLANRHYVYSPVYPSSPSSVDPYRGCSTQPAAA
jgi:transcriptional regulator with XRE-family HTH domain